ncbi:radical SAM protein [Tepidibacter formicigenes]|jgi:uncharacterized radical SAM superfamily protein|uniref:Elp3/MiaA/NifB-like radical SAM core domain-containing protein n=1 Tax=Tepidibacter formicigenes DSM 15518 TaxID=1123349 RepID=A0A1M6KU29_9FIRM|nr:radical SAM protein [Tepidibacter formicigenes]SHJ62465.1 hypothetical protein SAMN02744037_00478 [Tepidibacter formicigenes DSM 15518]
MKLKDKMKKALKIKEDNFGNKINFSYPNKTLAVTITGNECSLKCAHCNGHYLKNMTPIDNLYEKIKKRDIKSFLISGGCSFTGDVPINRYIDEIKNLKKQGYRLNAHLGLMSEEYIKNIVKYLDVVSFDLVLDDATIKEVYKINKTKEDYINTYKILNRYAKVIPHICIGLNKGKIKGEYEILKFLENENPKGITFIVLIPTKETEYENVAPPKIEDVIDIICEARIKFPNIPINLGCMRPRGEYRKKLDEMAVSSGVNNIVLPSKEAFNKAMKLGYDIQKLEECCVL